MEEHQTSRNNMVIAFLAFRHAKQMDYSYHISDISILLHSHELYIYTKIGLDQPSGSTLRVKTLPFKQSSWSETTHQTNQSYFSVETVLFSPMVSKTSSKPRSTVTPPSSPAPSWADIARRSTGGRGSGSPIRGPCKKSRRLAPDARGDVPFIGVQTEKEQ